MIVQILDDEETMRELKILFSKTPVSKRRKKNKKELIDTTCSIFVDGVLVCDTIAKQNPLDHYNKIVGRKVALAKAISQIRFLSPVSSTHVWFQKRREKRKMIWSIFHKTFGRWS